MLDCSRKFRSARRRSLRAAYSRPKFPVEFRRRQKPGHPITGGEIDKPAQRMRLMALVENTADVIVVDVGRNQQVDMKCPPLAVRSLRSADARRIRAFSGPPSIDVARPVHATTDLRSPLYRRRHQPAWSLFFTLTDELWPLLGQAIRSTSPIRALRAPFRHLCAPYAKEEMPFGGPSVLSL